MASGDEKIRCFIGIKPPDEALDALRNRREQLREELSEATFRWVSRPNLHITLHYLGEVHRSRLDDVIDAMNAAGAASRKFDLDAACLGCFPDRHRARVVWAGFRNPSPARGLHRRVGGELRRRDFTLESRAFTPHVTLARASRQASPQELAVAAEALRGRDGESICRFEVASMTLFRSRPRSPGPVYTVVHRTGF